MYLEFFLINWSIINLSTEAVSRLQEHKKEGFRNLSKMICLSVSAKCLYRLFILYIYLFFAQIENVRTQHAQFQVLPE